MRRIAVAAVLVVSLAGMAQAEAFKLCSKGLKMPATIVMDDNTNDDGILNMTITVDGKATKFEYGGSMATGSGVSQWFHDGDVALDDGDKIEWKGRTYNRCGLL